jgi:hypothetical protein
MQNNAAELQSPLEQTCLFACPQAAQLLPLKPDAKALASQSSSAVANAANAGAANLAGTHDVPTVK